MAVSAVQQAVDTDDASDAVSAVSAASAASDGAAVDFDLHGLVGVRLIDATPADAAAVARQLGPIRTTLSRDPDIVIRFVDCVETRGELRYLGVDDGAFDDDGFLVLRAKQKARTRVRIPMQDVGGRCEIICEHGVPAVPLLIAIVNLTALTKGVLPLHACAFEYQDTGIVVTGWSKGGKTETLLSFMRKGARYIADEWCYVDVDGDRIFGVPEPVRLWHWHLRSVPEFRSRVALRDRVRMTTLNAIPALYESLPRGVQRSRVGRMLARVAHVAGQQLNVLVPPERLFEQSVGATEGAFDALLLVMSAEGDQIRVDEIDSEEVARRMVHSLQYELEPFMLQYQMFRFAFPDRINPHLESSEETQTALLLRAFSAKRAWVVTHPYPVDITRLADAVAPVLHGERA